MINSNLKLYFEKFSSLTEQWFDNNIVPLAPMTEGLTKAMRYSFLNGGKRLRPVLVFASGEMFGVNEGLLLPYAVSVEMVHTYSLIHDDLPAMDNDDLRRGKPTCHKVFGEAEAILAGDALLTLAFEIIANDKYTSPVPDKIRLEAIKKLSIAAGYGGMVGGQFGDIISENKSITAQEMNFIHNKKTGALISYSCYVGALISNISVKDVNNLEDYGYNLGLAFQITDDILDITSTTEVLGKSVGKDEKSHKATYPSMYGLDVSYKMAQDAVNKCEDILSPYGKRGETLKQIARFVLERKS